MNIKVVSVLLTNGEISALSLALELSVDTVFFQVFPDDAECMYVQGTRTFPGSCLKRGCFRFVYQDIEL